MIQWLCQDLLAFNPAGLFYSTCMPGAVTSTDGFATVANQSGEQRLRQHAQGGEQLAARGRRRPVHRAVRAHADRACWIGRRWWRRTMVASGVWNPGLTSDGTHPAQATHAGVLASLAQASLGGFALPS